MSTITTGQQVLSHTAKGIKHDIHTHYYHRFCWEDERLKMKRNMAEHDSTALPEYIICCLCGESIHSQPIETPTRKLAKDRVKMIEQFAVLYETYDHMLKEHQASDQRIPDIAYRSAWSGKNEALDHSWRALSECKECRPDQVVNMAKKHLKFTKLSLWWAYGRIDEDPDSSYTQNHYQQRDVYRKFRQDVEAILYSSIGE